MSNSPESILELLVGHQRFLLTGHEHPDGDCLGSQVALYHLLRELGKDVVVRNPDHAPRNLDFLLRHTPLSGFDDEDLGDPDVVVLLDCSDLGRLGGMAAAVRSLSATIAVIDHHIGSEAGDGEVLYVDASAAATGALVGSLFEVLGVKMSPAAAEGVFVALAADTGWFRYSNTSAGVLEMAGQLTRAGADPSWLFDQMHRRNDPESVDVMSEGIGRSRLALAGALGVLPIDRRTIDRANRCGVDLDALMEPLRSVRGIEVVAMLKEVDARRVKLSLRSQGEIDVQVIARKFGGGGHRKAAGATLDVGLASAEAAVLEAVQAALSDCDREGDER